MERRKLFTKYSRNPAETNFQNERAKELVIMDENILKSRHIAKISDH